MFSCTDKVPLITGLPRLASQLPGNRPWHTAEQARGTGPSYSCGRPGFLSFAATAGMGKNKPPELFLPNKHLKGGTLKQAWQPTPRVTVQTPASSVMERVETGPSPERHGPWGHPTAWSPLGRQSCRPSHARRKQVSQRGTIPECTFPRFLSARLGLFLKPSACPQDRSPLPSVDTRAAGTCQPLAPEGAARTPAPALRTQTRPTCPGPSQRCTPAVYTQVAGEQGEEEP